MNLVFADKVAHRRIGDQDFHAHGAAFVVPARQQALTHDPFEHQHQLGGLDRDRSRPVQRNELPGLLADPGRVEIFPSMDFKSEDVLFDQTVDQGLYSAGVPPCLAFQPAYDLVCR